MPDRELLVRIVGDDRDLQRALGSTEKRVAQIDGRMERFGKNVTKAFAAAGIAVGTRELFQELAAAVDAASALNEEIAKSEQIFGDASGAIEAWSETTAGAIGVSQREALAATGTFGNLFATVGLGQDAAAGMSQELVTLAADLASFNNADISDVLAAIRSGLIGEAEPLRRFGVLLSESRVQLEAMEATGKDNAKELTNQEKALARFNIILTDTAVAQGDFARTQEGLANQSRILSAELQDLQAELGTKLLPTMVAVTSGAVDLIDALTQAGDTLDTDLFASLEDVDISALTDMRDRLAEIKGEGDDVVEILDQIIERLGQVQGIAVRPDDRAGPRGAGSVTASNARVDAERELDAAKKAKRELEKLRQEFRELGKGLGLKLDRAGLTAGLDDDIAALREFERAILRQIEREGRTFKLVDQLTQTRLQIASLVTRRADDARQAGEDAFNASLDALDLRLETARNTRSLADDQAALRAIEQRILRRIEAEGETTDLLRRLFDVRQEQKEIARQLKEQREQREKEDQFRQLGLTAEGETPTPGAGALLRRAQNLQEQIKGTALDTTKTRQQLAKIVQTLRDNFQNAKKEVRDAILDMLNGISSAMDEGDRKSGGGRQITPGGIRPLERLIAGANLSAEQIAQLQRNMQRRRSGRPVNAFGFDFDPGTFTTGGIDKSGGFSIPAPIVQVFIDSKEITPGLIKEIQKTGKRRTNRRGGSGAGRGAVL